MKNMVNHILQEKKKNINKELYKDCEIRQTVIATTNTMYNVTRKYM